MRRLAAALLVLLATSAAAVARSDAGVPPGAVAVVAGEAVPKSLFAAELNRRRHTYRLKNRQFPVAGTGAYRALRDRIVDLLVWRVELRQAAAALGVVVDPAEVERQLNQIRQQWGSNERQFQRELHKLGLTPALLRAEIVARVTYEAVGERFRQEATVTAQEVDQYYSEHVADFTTPPSRDIRDLVVRRRPLAERLYRLVRRGESFAALARRYSIDRRTRPHGGFVTVYAGQSQDRVVTIAFALPRGGVSGPVRSRGWHLVQALSAIRPGRIATEAEVADTIAEAIKRAKGNARLLEWVKDVRASYASKVAFAPGFAPGTP